LLVFVRYVGRSSTGVFLALDSGDVFVNHNAEIEVPDDVAASLADQPDNWQLVVPKSPPKKATPATPNEETS
jgi:hypothetical protein